jgi:hypothetical protein
MKGKSPIISVKFQIHVLIAMSNSIKQTSFPTVITFPLFFFVIPLKHVSLIRAKDTNGYLLEKKR